MQRMLSRKQFPIVGIIAAILLAMPLQLVRAQGAEITGTVLNILSVILENALIPVVSGGLEWSAKVLGYVMSPDFNGLPLTSGGVVDVGWEITRQMANLFVIFFLIVFSFMSLLNIDDKWQLQKLVPRLIILAILINFTKVISGVIVDASQLLMNFFISGGSGQQLSNAPLGLVQNMRIGDLYSPASGFFQSANVTEGSLEYSVLRFGSALLQFLFQGLTTWILTIIAVLFVMRVVAIWVLVILAPVAFLFGMLPGHFGGYLKQWFTYLIQWAFVGSFAMFFVFLAAVLAKSLADSESALSPAFTPPQGFDVSQFNQTAFIGDFAPLLVYMTIFVFLAIGYSIAKKTSVIGAAGVVGFVAGQQEKFAKMLGNKVVGYGKKGVFGVGRYARDVGKGLVIGSGAADAAIGALSQMGAPGRYFAERLARGVGDLEKGFERYEKSMDRLGADARVQTLRSKAQNYDKRAASLKSLADSGDLDAATATEFMPFAKRAAGKVGKSVEAAHPHLYHAGDPQKMFYATQKADPGKLHSDALTNPVVAYGINYKKIEKFIDGQDVAGLTNYKDTITRLHGNPAAITALAGQLGITTPLGIAAVTARIANANAQVISGTYPV